MSKDTDGMTKDEIAAKEARMAKLLRWGIIGTCVAIVLGFTWAVMKDAEEESAATSWDQYSKIRRDFEPDDLRWNNPRGVYTEKREKYHQILSTFLEKEATNWDGALEPQVRWRLARSLADQVLSSADEMSADKRAVWYDNAIKQMEIIRDKFPQYPLNWTRLHQNPDTPTLTRQFIRWLENNRKWESENLPTAKEPDSAQVVVIRTTRGDIRLKMFSSDAPKWTKAFLERAAQGAYDGTSLFWKKDVGTDADPEQHFVRGGGDGSRDAKPYDRDDATRLVGESGGGGVLPEESRNRIIQAAGTMCAWHERGSEYDEEVAFILLARRSPILDYQYTPVGKVMDAQSRATVERIYSSPVWNDDPDTVDNPNAKYQSALQVLQVPVKIVKILVFDASGRLVASEGEASATRDEPTSTESSLSALQADEYKVAAPKRVVVDNKKDNEATGGIKSDAADDESEEGSEDGAEDGANATDGE